MLAAANRVGRDTDQTQQAGKEAGREKPKEATQTPENKEKAAGQQAEREKVRETQLEVQQHIEILEATRTDLRHDEERLQKELEPEKNAARAS